MRLFMLLLVLPSLAVGCGGTDFDETESIDPSVHRPAGKADIYGTDDRREVFEAEAVYQKVADSTAVVVATSDFYVPSTGDIWLRNLSYTDKIRGTLGAPLCSSERFREQPAPGYCSAFLVAPDLVATAGHCVNQRYMCDDLRFVFGYQYEARAGEDEVRHVPRDNLYQCERIVGHIYDKDAVSLEAMMTSEYWSDWAVVRLDRPVVGRDPLPLRRTGTVADGGRVDAVGYPGGVPGKVTAGHVVDNDHDLYFNTDMDIYGGNSGGVVVNPDGLAEGIVIRGTGGASFSRQGSCYVSDSCEMWSPNRRLGCTGNHVMRIDPVLQFVDADRIVAESVTRDVAIPDGEGSAVLEIAIDDPGTIRFVTLNTSVHHWTPKDLEISLDRDSAHSAVLFRNPEIQKVDFSRTTDEFNGEPAAGNWTVRIRDLNGSGAWSQEVTFAELVIGIGPPVEPAPLATFIGSACGRAEDCTFSAEAQCLVYDDEGTDRGMCTLPCDGTCPDRTGFATTFCTSTDGGLSGQCVPRAHAANAYCADVPGTERIEAERYVGTSEASPSTVAVCLP